MPSTFALVSFCEASFTLSSGTGLKGSTTTLSHEAQPPHEMRTPPPCAAMTRPLCIRATYISFCFTCATILFVFSADNPAFRDTLYKHAPLCTRTEKLLYLYIGDSRTRLLYSNHLRSAHLNPDTPAYYYDDQRCVNNTFRYGNVGYCSKRRTALQIGCGEYLAILECWRSDLECFQRLQADSSSAISFLEDVLLRKIDVSLSEIKMVINFGLHDLVSGVSSPDDLVDGVVRVFENLASIDRPSLNITWVDLYPLIPPFENIQPKFPDWESINKDVTYAAPKLKAAATSFGFDLLDVAALLGDMRPSWSDDTVHLKDAINGYLELELLRVLRPSTILTNLTALHIPDEDIFCGNQDFVLPKRGDRVIIAFLGGSVTSDQKYVGHFLETVKHSHGWNAKGINLGEPATGSAYQSLCWPQTSNGTLSEANIIVLEFCVNDFDTNASSLRRLIKSIKLSKRRPIVLYYCHLAPRYRFDFRMLETHMNLAKELGITAVSNRFFMSNILKREESLFFRDDLHLTDRGAYHTGLLLLRAIETCAKNVHHAGPNQIGAQARDAIKPRNRTGNEFQTCYTGLGPLGSRNIDEVVINTEWQFVQDKHPSAPHGKNGFETTVAGTCLELALQIPCSTTVTLFHLFSSKASMGEAAVTLTKCENYYERISGFWENGLSITKEHVLSIPANCCSKQSQILKICSLKRATTTNSSRFRVMAVAVQGLTPQ